MNKMYIIIQSFILMKLDVESGVFQSFIFNLIYVSETNENKSSGRLFDFRGRSINVM